MLTIVAFDVLILIILLMLSVPLPFCFGGALGFMVIFGGASMTSMMLWAFNQSISLVLLGQSAVHSRRPVDPPRAASPNISLIS